MSRPESLGTGAVRRRAPAAPTPSYVRSLATDTGQPRPRNIHPRLVGAAAVAAALLAWELVARAEVWNPTYLVGPSQIVPVLWDLLANGTLLTASRSTLERVVVGYAISLPLGIVLGMICGLVRVVDWAVSPVVELVRAVPPLALLPVFLLLFGIGFSFPVAVIVWVAWVPIFLNTVSGVKGVSPELVDAARVFGADRWQMVRHVYVPYSVPSLLVGLRVGMGSAFLVVVAAEMVGTTSGLGYYIWDSSQTFRIDEMYAAIVLMGLLAFLANAAIVLLARIIWPYQGDLV